MFHCGDELVGRDEPIPVTCDCGTECCFKCLEEPHWPLNCAQLKLYNQRLVKDGKFRIAQHVSAVFTFSDLLDSTTITNQLWQCDDALISLLFL